MRMEQSLWARETASWIAAVLIGGWLVYEISGGLPLSPLHITAWAWGSFFITWLALSLSKSVTLTVDPNLRRVEVVKTGTVLRRREITDFADIVQVEAVANGVGGDDGFWFDIGLRLRSGRLQYLPVCGRRKAAEAYSLGSNIARLIGVPFHSDLQLGP